MSIVQAYCCDHTGKLFHIHQKAEYLRHLRREAYVRSKEKLRKKTVNRFTTTFEKMRSECKTLQDICDYIVLNPTLFYEYGCFADGRNKSKNWREFLITHVKMTLTYKPECSNSHGAPIGEETNWHRKLDKPMGFPGYYGRLTFRTNQETPFFTSKMFDGIGFYCGSGGGGTKSYGCEVTIWLQDWPGLRSAINDELNELMLDRLTDNLRGNKMKTHELEAYASVEE